MNREEWREIQSLGPIASASSFGRIKASSYFACYKNGRGRKVPERICKETNAQGYKAVCVHGKRYMVHSLVAEAFWGKKPENARTVNHIDGDKGNNRPENLEWASYAENNRHARLTKLNKQHGERCNLSKFGDDKVDAIRLLWPTKRFTQKELGDLFGMSENHVYEIVNRLSRKMPTA